MRRIVTSRLIVTMLAPLTAVLLASGCSSSAPSAAPVDSTPSDASTGASTTPLSITDLCTRLTASRAAIHLTAADNVPAPTVTEHPNEANPALSRSSCDVIESFDAKGNINAGLTLSLTTIAGYNALFSDLTGCFKGTIKSKVGKVLNYCSTKGGGFGAEAAAAVQVAGQVVLLVGEAAKKMSEDELVAAITIIVSGS